MHKKQMSGYVSQLLVIMGCMTLFKSLNLICKMEMIPTLPWRGRGSEDKEKIQWCEYSSDVNPVNCGSCLSFYWLLLQGNLPEGGAVEPASFSRKHWILIYFFSFQVNCWKYLTYSDSSFSFFSFLYKTEKTFGTNLGMKNAKQRHPCQCGSVGQCSDREMLWLEAIHPGRDAESFALSRNATWFLYLHDYEQEWLTFIYVSLTPGLALRTYGCLINICWSNEWKKWVKQTIQVVQELTSSFSTLLFPLHQQGLFRGMEMLSLKSNQCFPMRYKKLPAPKLDYYETFLGKKKKKQERQEMKNNGVP